MRRRRSVTVVLAVVILFVCFCAGQQQQSKSVTNDDIVQMVKAGLGESTILLTIQRGPAAFDTSPAALGELKKSGVSSAVMDAMLKATVSPSPAPQTRSVKDRHTPTEHAEKGKTVPAAEGMRFTLQGNGGNCESCVWVLAEGDIDAGTTEKFKALVETTKPPSNIRFNSLGGDVIEAIKFGQFLRESNWDTFVGEARPRVPNNFSEYKTQQSICYSACVYAFAGGVHRTADDKSVGIHQFYRRGAAARPNDKSLSAVDVANMQRLAALLNEFVRRMGVDPRLVSIASAITPWEPIYLLSSAELKSLNLDNTSALNSEASTDWRVQPAGNGAMAITEQTQDGAGRVASLGIMCIQSMPNMVIIRLAVRDDTKDWAYAFTLDLSPINFNVEIDGKFELLDRKRLVSPVRRSGNGATLALAISKDELGRMIKAKSVKIAGNEGHAIGAWIGGDLGGRFSMTGARDVIALALNNCVSQSTAAQ